MSATAGFDRAWTARCPPADHPGSTSTPIGAATSFERFFALAKQWRGIATRYDKLAITYRAGVTLCAILTWTRLIADT